MKTRDLSILLAFLVLFRFPALAQADGGAVRLCEQVGDYRVTVFTSPTPLRTGPVDVSVLIQDKATGECRPEARVRVRLTASESGRTLEQQATSASATNKLYQAALFQLDEAGWWDAEVFVEGQNVRFGVWVDEPLPGWRDLWPWFSWPAVVVALFVWRAERRKPPGCADPQPGSSRSSAHRYQASIL